MLNELRPLWRAERLVGGLVIAKVPVPLHLFCQPVVQHSRTLQFRLRAPINIFHLRFLPDLQYLVYI